MVEEAVRTEAAKELERALQQAADEAEFCCPRCRMDLNMIAHGKQRTVSSVAGTLSFSRSYGFCLRCETYSFPADVQLGLAPRATASPRVQEVCATMVLSAPAAVAADRRTQLAFCTLLINFFLIIQHGVVLCHKGANIAY